MGQAWKVGLLPIVECYLPSELTDWGDFSHVSTRLRDYKLEGVEFQHGETVWRGLVEGKSAAVGWEWVEVRPGVVGLLHPNSIATNLRFMAHKSCHVSVTQAIVNANRLIHAWPWQVVVQAVLRGQAPTCAPIVPKHERQMPSTRSQFSRPVGRRAEQRAIA